MAHAESVKKYSVGDSPEFALLGDSDFSGIFRCAARLMAVGKKAALAGS